MSDLTAVVLAAGLGTRMKSSLPKVLHRAAGRALVEYPVRAALSLGAARVVVVTSPNPELFAFFPKTFGDRVVSVVQDPPRGTGDAARLGLAAVETEHVLVLCGDTPLVTADELARVVDAAKSADLAVGVAELAEPHGYGRILRDADGRVREIREHRDLRTDLERAVREVNAGIYAGRRESLAAALSALTPNNAQGEYYLTDVVAALARTGTVVTVRGHADALMGVNDREQLRQAEEALFANIRARLGRSGVTVHGDARIDDTVVVEPGAEIEAAVRLRGSTTVGAGAFIDIGSVVTDATLGPRAVLKPYSVVGSSSVGEAAQIGPFSHLRPDSVIEADAHIGNFVETKKTRVRRGAKANHLAYLGDGDVGERANVGAGTIFCNYDGYQKHQTIIGAEAFIGSDSQLVAPVSIGKGAYVASGSSITEDVPDGALAIARARQTTKPERAAPLKARLEAAAREAKRKKRA
jgi:bifunctional UDP-N-acetylglucosamine pyrophosphorylase / glucosamine-1-phosphate N-acetyltransferase